MCPDCGFPVKPISAPPSGKVCMDSDRYDQYKLDRCGKTGYLYQIDNPTNPEMGEKTPDIGIGTLELNDSVPWNTK